VILSSIFSSIACRRELKEKVAEEANGDASTWVERARAPTALRERERETENISHSYTEPQCGRKGAVKT
jgi:hypothetical protein